MEYEIYVIESDQPTKDIEAAQQYVETLDWSKVDGQWFILNGVNSRVLVVRE